MRVLRVTAAASLLLALACAPEEAPGPGAPTAAAAQRPGAALRPVPEPDLAAAEEGVRQQIGRYRARLDELLAAASSAAEERAEAFGDLGLRYLIYDFLDAAEVSFANARALAPEDFRWVYLGGYMHKIQGRLAEAGELFERALALEPDFLPAVLRLARTRLELGDGAAARELFERALTLEPSSAAAFEGLAELAAAEGDVASEVDYLEQALAEAPQASSLHYALGQAYRKLGDLDKARFHLARRGDVAVRVPDPLLNPLADIGAGVQFYVLRGKEALDKGEFETAAAAFARALEEDPEDFSAYRGASMAVDKLGDHDGAVRYLETALEKATTGDAAEDRRQRAEAHRVLGALLALRGDDRGAAAHFSSSLELDPEQAGVRLKLANALARRGRFAEALEHYDRLLASHPGYAAELRAKRATALVNLGRRDEAIAEFRRAVEAAPEDPRLRLRFAEALEYLGETEAAAEQWAAAARLAGDDAQRARLLAEDGSRLVSQGRFEEAVAQFTESLALDPERMAVRNELASVLGHLGRLDQAVAEYRKVIDAEPRHAAARRGEILALLLAGRYGQARVRLQEALAEFPQDADLAHLQARLLASVPDPRVRDGRLALEIARRLAAVRQELRVRETLAMALAESGRFGEAVEVQKGVVAEAEQSGDADLVSDVGRKLEAFERGEPWAFRSADELLAATLGGGRAGRSSGEP